MISLVMVFIFSVNIAYSAKKMISWMNMFEDMSAYEEAMRSAGIHNYDIVKDATEMMSDANVYERDARTLVNESINKKRSGYLIERDINDLHRRRLGELQEKWKRSSYLVECATKMAESVRDSNLERMKPLAAADPHRDGVLVDRSGASTATQYVAPEEHEVINLVGRATVFVIVMSANEDQAGSGTGFFVAPGFILTNRHVIKERNAKVVVLSKFLGRPVPAQIVAISERKERDYALLRIGQPPSGYPSSLKFSTEAKPADKVTAWGFPGAAIRSDPQYAAMLKGDMRSAPDVVYSEGIISEIRDHAPTVTRHNQPPPVIIYSAVTSPGNSGGPLVNTKGQVVGIHAGRYYGDAHRQSGRAICATDVIKFIREHDITPTVASGSR